MTIQRLLQQRSCLSLLTLVVLFASGCSTLPNGERWGQNAHFPTWEKLKSSAWKAARDPRTWAPLAGVAVLSIGDLDEDLSDWAVRENPIFGSESSADDASDILAEVLGGAAIVSALSTPGGPGGSGWASAKSKGLLVELAAVSVAGAATTTLKNSVNRRRPDKSNNRSFPSGHTTAAASFAVLTTRNVDSIKMAPTTRKVLKVSADVLTVGTAWARVESEEHYPRDVMFGAALGYFLTAVVHDSMIGLDSPVQVGVKLDGNSGGMLTFHMPF